MFIKKNMSLILLVVLICNISAAQNQNQITKQDLRDITGLNRNTKVFVTKSSTQTIGSPYLNPNFYKGHMIIKGTKTKPTFIRYNIYNNEVEFLRNGDIFVTDAKKIDGFKFYTSNGGILFRSGFKNKKYNITPEQFLRIIYNNEVLLVSESSASLIEDLASYGNATKQNKYQAFEKYYLVTSGGEYKKINVSKFKIEGIESESQSELNTKINKFIQKNDLDVSDNNDDLIKLAKFYEKAKEQG